MTRKNQVTGFWTPGASLFMDELGKEEARSLAALKRRLQEADGPEGREEIKRRMAEVKTEFRRKRRNALYNLFAGS